ncbi:MAG: hypothetical protein ABFS14_11485 [Gemmatimonadota bacterium]
MTKLLLTALAASAAFACGSSPFDPPVRRLGTLQTTEDGFAIEVPDTVQARQSFEISAKTTGNGCVSFGGTEVEVEGSVVEFRPFDLDVAFGRDDVFCTEILKVFDHAASVQIDQPGTVTVRIHGMAHTSDGNLGEIVIERIVVVS